MRILHVLDHSIPLQSGYSFRTLAILEQQRVLGWETLHFNFSKAYTALCSGGGNFDGWSFFRTPAATKTFSQLPIVREWALMRQTELRLLEVTKKAKPDIIHAHSPVLNAVPAIRAGKKLNVPVVYEVRAFWEDAAASHGTGHEGGLGYRATRMLETWALKRADAVTTICEGLRNDIIDRGISSDHVTVISNAVNADEFTSGGEPDAMLAQELGITSSTILGFVGSFYGYEGLHLLCRALPQILKSRPNAKLLLVGGGPEEDRLKSLADELGLTEQIVFTGRVPHDQVQKYYDLIEVLVYPRSRIRLTDLVTPLKPLEAVAINKILVASDVGGHLELIRDGETGNLFKADNVEDLADTVLRVLDTQENWKRQRAAGRHFVENERSWKNSVSNYIDVYSRLTTLGQLSQ